MESHLRSEDGHLTEEGTALYVDALKLSRLSKLPRWMVDHVGDCRICKERVTGLYALLPADSHAGLKTHPYFGSLAHSRNWYRVAPAIALIAAGGATAALLIYERSRPPTEAAAPAVPPAKDAAAREVARPAVAFAENPEMESLVNARARSGETTVVSPAIGAEIRGTVTFNWKGAGAATVEVLDNAQGRVAMLPAQQPPVVLRKELSAGLYYWKLIANDELLLVGKFSVR